MDEAAALDGVTVLHAGTAIGDDGALVTAGGRVLGIVGQGPTLAEARARAYAGVSAVSWPAMQVRSDIALAASGEEGSAPPTPAPEPQGASR